MTYEVLFELLRFLDLSVLLLTIPDLLIKTCRLLAIIRLLILGSGLSPYLLLTVVAFTPGR